jgi:CotH kinase protein
MSMRKLMFIPWDQDGSFGNIRMGSESRAIYYPWSNTNPVVGRLYEVDAFRNACLSYLAEFTKTIFRPERFAEQIAQIAPVIRPAVEEEGAQWLTGFDAVVTGRAGILPFAKARAAFVAAQLAK